MIALLRRAIDVLDPQPKLVPPVTEAEYLADLDQARAEGRRDAYRALVEWLTPLAESCAANADMCEDDSPGRTAWNSRAGALDVVIEWCKARSRG